MKKVNTCFWLTALLSLAAISPAFSSDFSLNFYNSEKLNRFEQSTNYSLLLSPGWQMFFTNRNLEDRRLDFNQVSKNNALNVRLQKQAKLVNLGLKGGYESFSDYSSLQSALKPYENRTGYIGCSMRLTPLDSLFMETDLRAYLRTEQDRYREDKVFRSSGMYDRLSAGWNIINSPQFLQLTAALENKKLDWEAFSLASAGLISTYNSQSVNLAFNAAATYRTEDLYVLNPPLSDHLDSYYLKYDSQIRRYLTSSLNASWAIRELLVCEAHESYTLNTSRNRENRDRNSGDYNNLASLGFTYYASKNLLVRNTNTHSYYIKDLSSINNTRIIDIRNSGWGMTWEYAPYDSLLFDYNLELRRTEYPDNGHKLDNDYLNATYKFGWIAFWKDRLKLANRFLYLEKEEVFLNSSLSAYNCSVKGYQWLPELDLLLGDSFLLHQGYQLRADYDNFTYNDFSNIKDTFYRKVSAAYSLVYDNTPLAAKLTQPKWNLLPYRNRNREAFRMETGFGWERTETAARNGSVYEINGIDERKSVSLTLQKQLGIAICQLQPKCTWGSWREYGLLVSAAFQLNQTSLAEISFNPVGPDFDELDYRVSGSVNLMF